MAEFEQSKMTVILPRKNHRGAVAILVSPESLEKYWEEFCDAPKDDRHCIKEPFLMFPKGTNDFEICAWFDKMYPDGLLALMKKRMAKKFGEEYVKNWDNFEKRMSIGLVDDVACLTEEDKKRLLLEFASDKEEK